MLQKKYKSEVVSIKNPVEGIYTVEFRSLNGRYRYNPGQFLHLALDQEYDGSGQWPESRCFSMQSNPEEENIVITYSVKGEFTKQMSLDLRLGSEVRLKLPYGDLFSQPHNKYKTVFIAGGTGVTPFLSLFTHESFNEYINPHIYLGFRSKKYNIYTSELSTLNLRKICNEFVEIKEVYQDTDGLINIDNVLSESDPRSDYFLSGPPLMLKVFKSKMIKKGIKENQIFSDNWE